MTRAQMEVEGRGEQQDPHFALPPSLLRRYEVLVRPRSKAARSKLRDISADCIGSLVTFKGIVTQVGAGVGAAGGKPWGAAGVAYHSLSARLAPPVAAPCSPLRARPPSPHPQVSDVRPLLTVATYLDDQTGFEIYQEVCAAGGVG